MTLQLNENKISVKGNRLRNPSTFHRARIRSRSRMKQYHFGRTCYYHVTSSKYRRLLEQNNQGTHFEAACHYFIEAALSLFPSSIHLIRLQVFSSLFENIS